MEIALSFPFCPLGEGYTLHPAWQLSHIWQKNTHQSSPISPSPALTLGKDDGQQITAVAVSNGNSYSVKGTERQLSVTTPE